jgi:hypothetical protein
VAGLLQDPERMAQMSSAARARMLERTPERFFDDFWQTHYELVFSPEGPRGE